MTGIEGRRVGSVIEYCRSNVDSYKNSTELDQVHHGDSDRVATSLRLSPHFINVPYSIYVLSGLALGPLGCFKRYTWIVIDVIIHLI